jgi:hypothetical protein
MPVQNAVLVSAAKTITMTHFPSLCGNKNPQMLELYRSDMSCQSDTSSLQSHIVASKAYPGPCLQGAL